jgi:type II secretory pathway pseudopilin PulG
MSTNFSCRARGKLNPERPFGRTGRRALTVLELLVVFAIIGILISVLLVAVQRTREASRQLSCMSNLRQIALASELHLDRQRHFVSNGWGFNWGPDPQRGLGPDQPAGWIYQLAFDLDRPATVFFAATNHHEQTHPYLTIVRCPSRPAPLFGPVTTVLRPVNYRWTELAPKTDYAINEGDRVTGTGGGPASVNVDQIAQYDWRRGPLATGISSQRSRVTAAMVTDGLSHTYLVAEKHVLHSEYDSAGDKGYDQSCWTGVDLDLNRWTNSMPLPDRRLGTGRQFGSAHPGIWHASFCDGSVRKMTFDINIEIHQAHGNRADSGFVLADPFGA